MRRPRFFHSALSILVAGLIAGCAVGPDYQRPSSPTPPGWGWKVAEPRDESIRGDWWQLFHDPELTRLENQATAANQTVQAAMARVDQARAVARITASRFAPQIGFDPSLNRFHTQLNHVPSLLTATQTTLPLDLSYEVDLWGKIRRAFEASRAQAAASAADYYQVLLTLHGDVAANYFLLRQAEAQVEILQRTVELRQKAVDIVAQRQQVGLAPAFDLDRARTELAQSNTTLTEMQRQRTTLRDTIALLCGQPAPGFHIASGKLERDIPSVPTGLPSALVERRPDIAAAERRMAAANAQIGVAKAAFFPSITLTGDMGYSSFHASTLLDWESHLFQVGPAVTMPLLNGGRLTAGLKDAKANYRAVCAGYQQQVLVAFKEVSDALVDVNSYAKQAGSEKDAVASSTRAADSSYERYQQGLVPYFDVLDSQRTQLQTELQAAQLNGLRLISTVHLIKALGGGFNQATAPKL
ncbi:RND efflux system, outer membrane lipoprotein, NodT family [Chthoniobacter flavus Ellin428]|uniref:RND efflux system, outer membrane lipoprotein, NodT family n=1 Tax=Chthoniobacter flavus Ellin428 TaxID=497964 RepID=B4CUL1_9BACT|nr:efflux transporter outer membrane subunit [Chthoniobacter flavus]EDY22249.1 RND efflux system, outer membrane lipoprotein, NodT family [Chthoniobacter flavus Ellin428]TCO94729.1 multidrug efflux system outer membrane protein [Chthoniobacter flavus]